LKSIKQDKKEIIMKKLTYTLIVLCTVSFLVSCAGRTKQERGVNTGAAIGAGLGAIVGQAIGHSTEATVIGTGIGAILGGITGDQVGAYMDKQERDLRAAVAAERAESDRRMEQARASAEKTRASDEAASIQRTNDVLTTTFRSEFLFDFDSNQLKPGAEKEINRVADVLKKYPHTAIRVEGYTDEKGSVAYNQKLSEKRADSVRTALIQAGVEEHRISAVGYGETQPISSDHADNRRVNIVIIPVAEAKG
jgi:outer membrane protein OmpA-like peptidoglycan-associated protein